MSGVVDVGDAIELTFSTATGAAVTVTWIDPDLQTVLDDAVAESPPGSTLYPKVFLADRPGMWQALFTASGSATAVESYYVRARSVTGPPPLAAVGDVVGQFGALTPVQESLVNWLIRAASSMVRARFPGIDAQLTAGQLDPDVVALAIANMILRVLRNPGGLRAETTGPFSRTYDTTYAAGLLVITENELPMFTPTAVLTGSAMGTARLHAALAPPPRGDCRAWW